MLALILFNIILLSQSYVGPGIFSGEMERQERTNKGGRDLANDPAEQTLQLQSLLKLGGISKRGLETILSRLESRADLLTGSAGRLRDVSHARWLLVRHGETLPTTDGGTFEWEFCNPNLLMAMMINDSPALQEVYANVANKMRDDPCSLVITFDEYVPGSLKRQVTNRKSMNVNTKRWKLP